MVFQVTYTILVTYMILLAGVEDLMDSSFSKKRGGRTVRFKEDTNQTKRFKVRDISSKHNLLFIHLNVFSKD